MKVKRGPYFSHSIKGAKAVRKQFSVEHFLPLVHFKEPQLCSVVRPLVADSRHYSLLIVLNYLLIKYINTFLTVVKGQCLVFFYIYLKWPLTRNGVSVVMTRIKALQKFIHEFHKANDH